MTTTKVLTAIIFPLLLSSCSQFTAIFQDSGTRLEQLLNQDEYHQAQQLIAKLKADDPLYIQYEELNKDINQRATQYESQQIATIKELEKNLQWQEAITIANQAHNKLPESKLINESRETLLKNKEQYAENQALKLAIEQAKHLPIQTEILTTIEQTSQRDRNRTNYLKQTQIQLQNAHSKLIQAATTAIDRQQWEAARQYLLLAKNIRSNEEMEQLIAETQNKITLKKQEQTRSDENQQQQNLSQILASLNSAIEQDQLGHAIALSPKLDPWKNQKEVAELLEKLTRIVNKKVNELSTYGQLLYSQGLLDSAIEQWQQAIALDPSNSEIEDKLHRAEAFKANYEKLKQ
jgi:hypothetical protein